MYMLCQKKNLGDHTVCISKYIYSNTQFAIFSSICECITLIYSWLHCPFFFLIICVHIYLCVSKHIGSQGQLTTFWSILDRIASDFFVCNEYTHATYICNTNMLPDISTMSWSICASHCLCFCVRIRIHKHKYK